MKTLITLILLLSLTACMTGLDKKMYVNTDRYQDEYFNICLNSYRFRDKSVSRRSSLCNYMAKWALNKSRRSYKSSNLHDYHYNNCKSLFKADRKVEACFKVFQHTFYKTVAKSAYALFPKN